MISLENLDERLREIEERNKRVETDKAWETSLIRKILLAIFTYLAVAIYLQIIGINNAWLSAIVPTVGFLLSTLTLPFFKNLWTKYIYKK